MDRNFIIRGDKLRYKEIQDVFEYVTKKKCKLKCSAPYLSYKCDWYGNVFTVWERSITIDEFYKKYNLTYSDICQELCQKKKKQS